MNLETLQSAFSAPQGFVVEEVIFQMLALIGLSAILSVVYLFRGNSLSNRARLAALLPLMALTTMLIISIVKSSLALSLGLVGALSIVRFRAAIKDPEELAYIFLTIALGLGFGADQAVMTSAFFGVIVAYILVQSALKGTLGAWFTDRDSVHVEMTFSKRQELAAVQAVLMAAAQQVKLTRMDQGDQQMMMFLIKPKSLAALEKMNHDLLKLDQKMKLTILQYQPLI